jgi:hypothetical protein
MNELRIVGSKISVLTCMAAWLADWLPSSLFYLQVTVQEFFL